jgi:hypothetical protein
VAEHQLAQIRDHPLAEHRHQIVAQRACGGEHGGDHDHGAEIAVDEIEALAGEAEIDHAPHRDRHRQRRQRGDDERDQRPDRMRAVTQHERQQPGERPQARSARRRVGRRGNGARRAPGDREFRWTCAGPVVHFLVSNGSRRAPGRTDAGQCPDNAPQPSP